MMNKRKWDYIPKISHEKKGASSNQKSIRLIHPHSPFHTLQRNLGNQAMQQLLETSLIQAKLNIGQPGDKYEQEADRVAEKVMNMPDEAVYDLPKIPEKVHRKCTKEDGDIQCRSLFTNIAPLIQRQDEMIEEDDEEEKLQTKEALAKTPVGVHRITADLGNIRSEGQPLPIFVRTFFEPRFGCNFGSIRAHYDTSSQQLANALNAQAFTLGKDIYFGRGKYQPETIEGKRLIAHELTHTIQQGKTGSSRFQTIQLAPVPSSINGVTMIKDSGVVDTNLKDVVTDVLDNVIKSTMDGVTLNALYVSSANDGAHAANSRHYQNLAIDMSRLKTSGATNWQYMSTSYPSNTDVKKVVEALQNGFEGEVGTPGVRENYGPYFEKKNGVNNPVGGHGNHIHISCNE